MAEKGGTKILAIVTICVILFPILFSGCVDDNSNNENEDDDGYYFIDENLIGNGTIEDEEYKVYTAVLQQMDYINSNIELFVIEEWTSNRYLFDDFWIDFFKKETKVGLNTSLIKNYQQKNIMIYRLQNNFSITQNVVLISYQQLHEIFDRGGWWDEFYDRYPNSTGIIELSRVGFDNNRTQAILYFGNQAGGKAGIGYFILLYKNMDEWIIYKKVLIWIS